MVMVMVLVKGMVEVTVSVKVIVLVMVKVKAMVMVLVGVMVLVKVMVKVRGMVMVGEVWDEECNDKACCTSLEAQHSVLQLCHKGGVAHGS